MKTLKMKLMNMKKSMSNSQRGFTLLEFIVAAAIGITVVMAMTQMFRMGMNAIFTVTQRAEAQQNMRAGIEMMTKDISMAGAGLPTGGLQLAAGPATKVACNQAGTCYVPGDVYPNNPAGTSDNYMYGILPGFANGVENGAVITSAPGATNDSITSVYCDYNFPLTNFSFSFPVNGYQTTVSVVNGAVIPNNIQAPGGLNVGDLLFFQVTTPGTGTGNQGTSSTQTAAVVAEITGIPSGTQIDFAGGDSLNFNQTSANSLYNVVSTFGSNLGAGNTVSVCRLEVVTYFLEVPVGGGTVQTPRLMRQVNGLNAVPVADNIINLQFSYDVINSTSNSVTANQANPIAAGLDLALTQKVNMWVMSQSLLASGSRYQSMYLASSVSAGNMSFCNSFTVGSSVCQQ
jgi:prepilin-type N-terminal cleavage/methylation domain-containing protein